MSLLAWNTLYLANKYTDSCKKVHLLTRIVQRTYKRNLIFCMSPLAIDNSLHLTWYGLVEWRQILQSYVPPKSFTKFFSALFSMLRACVIACSSFNKFKMGFKSRLCSPPLQTASRSDQHTFFGHGKNIKKMSKGKENE